MSKNKNNDPIEPTGINEPTEEVATPAENDTALAELTAQHDALTAEVLSLSDKVAALESENAALRVQIELLSAKTAEVANSVSIAPPAPKAPVKPKVEIDGVQYEFKVGEVRIGRRIVSAASIAADDTALAEVFGKYPGLFRKV